jgi:hypothetical protein
MTACAATSSSRTSSPWSTPPVRSPRTTSPEPPRPRPPFRRAAACSAAPSAAVCAALLAALLLAALLLGACTQSSTFYGAPAAELHGKRLLLLEPSLIAPTPPELHKRVVEQIEAAMAASPDVGEVLGRDAFRLNSNVSLQAKQAYELFSSSLSLTGMADPELSNRLYKELGVELLAVAQPVFLPCATCDEGDQLWLVGQVVDARTGRIVFRAHLRSPSSADPQSMSDLAESLTAQYVDEMAVAFRLRAHRERFRNLKALAGSPKPSQQ